MKNLKELGYSVSDIVIATTQVNDCYFFTKKWSKRVNETIRSYGFTTNDIREYLSFNNRQAKDKAERIVAAWHRERCSFPDRYCKEFNYRVRRGGASVLQIDEKKISEILQTSKFPRYRKHGQTIIKTTIEERIAKYLKVEVSKVNIGRYEWRENHKGERLESGRPVYVLMNTGVEEDEESSEFLGWIINERWIKENC